MPLIARLAAGGRITGARRRPGYAPSVLDIPASELRAKNEVEPLMKIAEAAGATVLKPAREAAWGGYSGCFADPDGFAWELAWNPEWRLAPDGSIHIPTQ